MNFRKLIEKAMHEAREEFAEIVARKLAELMGDEDVRPAPAKRGRKPVAATKPKAAAGRTRAPADHMAALRQKIIAAMKPGEPLKKSAILAAARLGESEAARVGNVLKRLKDEGILTMKGQKAAATYTLRS